MGKTTAKRTEKFNSVQLSLLRELSKACAALGWTRNVALARLTEREDFIELVQAGLALNAERLARQTGAGPAMVKRLCFNLPVHLARKLASAAEQAKCRPGDVMAAALLAIHGNMRLALLGTVALSPEERKILAATP